MTEIPYNIGARWLTDLEFDFDVNENWGVSFAAINMFDKLPDTLPQPLVPTNQYYVYAHNGPLTGDGGFYSATFRYRF
jgi:iron complex outermembrane receptor protein